MSAERLMEIYNRIDKQDSMYKLLFPSGWGIYSEIWCKLNKAECAPIPGMMTTFGLDFGFSTNDFSITELAKDKYGFLGTIGHCREYIQDHAWSLLKGVGVKDFGQLEAIIKRPRSNIFWETSAYTGKKYKGLRTWDTLSGGIWCRIEDKQLEMAGSIDPYVKILDLIMGVPFMLLDQYEDTLAKRKTVKKGIAGRYVLDSSDSKKDHRGNNIRVHQFLYLLPGNTVLRAPWILSFAIGLARRARTVTISNDQTLPKFFSSLIPTKKMRNAVNNNNFKSLKEIWGVVKPLYAAELLGVGTGYGVLRCKKSSTGQGMKQQGISESHIEKIDKMFIPTIAFEFIVSKGGFPAMDKTLKENWRLNQDMLGHGGTAIGWLTAAYVFLSKNLDEYTDFYESYKADRVNF